MSKPPRDKIAVLMVSLTIMAFVSLGYYYFIAFRLDWVRYIKEPLYWRIENLSCPGKRAEAVVVLSEEQNSDPKYTLSNDPILARYMDTLPPGQQVTVTIKRRGYLWEFNYIAQLTVLSIETRGIEDYMRKLPDDLENCTYSPLPADGFEPL